MTRDEIIKMSQKAGFDPVTDIGSKFELFELFANLVAEAEREACAKLAAQTICDRFTPMGTNKYVINIYGTRAAEAIRESGDK
jgi:hypothetical protein